MKRIKKIIAPIIATSVILSSALSVNVCAVRVSRLVDNDTIAQGCSNDRIGFSSYMSYGYLYNGDARIENSANSNDWYQWSYPPSGPSGNTMTVSLAVYLNHARFTDPDARYYVQIAQDIGSTVGRINQQTAANGWNYLPSATISSIYAGGGFVSHYVEVWPSGSPYRETGADAIQINYIN